MQLDNAINKITSSYAAIVGPPKVL